MFFYTFDDNLNCGVRLGLLLFLSEIYILLLNDDSMTILYFWHPCLF
jgi:hypothetical protein